MLIQIVGFVRVLRFFGFMPNVVDIKFTAPRMEDTPTKCKEKTARSHYYYYYYYYYSNGKYWATVSPELSGPPWDPDYRGIFLVPTSQTTFFLIHYKGQI